MGWTWPEPFKFVTDDDHKIDVLHDPPEWIAHLARATLRRDATMAVPITRHDLGGVQDFMVLTMLLPALC